MVMRKEYVVVRIDAAPDGAPYVVVSLSSKKDMQEKDGPLSSPFGKANVMGFSNMNDMAKELNKRTPNLKHFRHYLEEAHNSFLSK